MDGCRVTRAGSPVAPETPRTKEGSHWLVPFLVVAAASVSACAAPAPPKHGALTASAEEPASAPDKGESDSPSQTSHKKSSKALCAEHARDVPLRVEHGRASYYADSLAGHPTASGVPYEPTELQAAHRKLPFGSVVRVRRADSTESTCVVIRDRGPFGDKNRIIDLSRVAAEELGIIRLGVADVVVELLYEPASKKKR